MAQKLVLMQQILFILETGKKNQEIPQLSENCNWMEARSGRIYVPLRKLDQEGFMCRYMMVLGFRWSWDLDDLSYKGIAMLTFAMSPPHAETLALLHTWLWALHH